MENFRAGSQKRNVEFTVYVIKLDRFQSSAPELRLCDDDLPWLTHGHLYQNAFRNHQKRILHVERRTGLPLVGS